MTIFVSVRKSYVIHCDDVSRDTFLTKRVAFRFELAPAVDIAIWNVYRRFVWHSEEIQFLEYGTNKHKHSPLLSLTRAGQSGFRSPEGGDKRFSDLHTCPNHGAHSVFYTMGTGYLSLVKADGAWR
jgi:hypothetical protein